MLRVTFREPIIFMIIIMKRFFRVGWETLVSVLWVVGVLTLSLNVLSTMWSRPYAWEVALFVTKIFCKSLVRTEESQV